MASDTLFDQIVQKEPTPFLSDTSPGVSKSFEHGVFYKTNEPGFEFFCKRLQCSLVLIVVVFFYQIGSEAEFLLNRLKGGFFQKGRVLYKCG